MANTSPVSNPKKDDFIVWIWPRTMNLANPEEDLFG